MALNPNINNREFEKFEQNSGDGGTDVRVNIKGGGATPSGLKTAGKITEVMLNSSTWTALPTTSLTARNALGVQNPSGIEIKVGFDNTEPGYVGWRVSADGEFFTDITDAIPIYGKSSSGTPTVTVMELS